MPYQTYEFKFSGRTIGIKAQKDEAEKIIRRFRRVLILNQWVKELHGVIGKSESTSTYYTPFGPSGTPITNEPEFKVAIGTLASKLPELLTPEIAAPFLEEADKIFNTHIPVRDRRESPEQVAERNAKAEEFQVKLKAESDAWKAQWCKPGVEVAIGEGEMGVYLSMCFDDSYSMTDYFSPHRRIGVEMLLAVVQKGPRTERVARDTLARYPELAKLKWEWNTENYSMGHGNYLMSEWTGRIEKQGAYDGRTEVNTRWEIQFWPYTKQFDVYKDYPGNLTATTPAPSIDSGQPDLFAEHPPVATVQRNTVHSGIEVRFSQKPDEATIDRLKTMGYRWSGRHGLWYTNYSETKLKEVREFLNIPQ